MVHRVIDGKTYSLTVDEAAWLVDQGIRNHISDKSSVTPTPTEPEIPVAEQTESDRIGILESKLQKFEDQDKTARELKIMHDAFTTESLKHEITSRDPEVKQLVDLVGFSNMTLNPNANIPLMYKQIADKFETIVSKATKLAEEKFTSTSRMKNFMNATPRSSGSIPQVEAPKKELTADALNNGAAQRGFKEMLATILREKGEL